MPEPACRLIVDPHLAFARVLALLAAVCASAGCESDDCPPPLGDHVVSIDDLIVSVTPRPVEQDAGHRETVSYSLTISDPSVAVFAWTGTGEEEGFVVWGAPQPPGVPLETNDHEILCLVADTGFTLSYGGLVERYVPPDEARGYSIDQKDARGACRNTVPASGQAGIPMNCPPVSGDDDDSTPPGDDDDSTPPGDDDDTTGDPCNDAIDAAMLELSEALTGDPLSLCTGSGLPDNGGALLSDGLGTDPHQEDGQSVASWVQLALNLSSNAADELFGSAARDALFPCGSAGQGLTLCDGSAGAFPPGDTVVVVNQVYVDIPTADASNIYQYGFVFDSDDDPADNYQASVQYPADFFHDTDLWFVAAHDPASGWELQVTDASNGQFVSIATDARIIIKGNVMALVVPASEFASATPPWRITAFRHTGDYGLQSGDWDGDIEPPVAEGLHPFSP